MSATSTWTVLAMLRWTTDYFARHGIESARLDAENLLAHVLGVSRLRLYLDFEMPVAADARARFRELIKERAKRRVPVAYLVGEKEFWSMPLEVNSAVLTPRPETEVLVEAVLSRLPDPEAELSGLEIGVGSGAVSLALARERPKWKLVAVDISPAALEVAARNAARHELEDRVRLLESDLFDALPGARFDLVVANPPYVDPAMESRLAPELAHEPRAALFAEAGGMALLSRIVREAPRYLQPGAWLALEFDPAQQAQLARELEAAGFESPEWRRDLSGRVRALSARRAAPGPQAAAK